MSGTSAPLVHYLPLSSLDPPWVDVSPLEEGEPELARGSVVAVRCALRHGHLQLLQGLEDRRTRVVGSSVPPDQRLLTPASTLLVEGLDEAADEELGQL